MAMMGSKIQAVDFVDDAELSSFEDEFVQLLTSHQGSLHQFIMSLIPIPDVRNDIVQEVNLILWKKRSEFKLGSNFKAWAFTVARFVTMNQQQKHKKQGFLAFDDDVLEVLFQQWHQAAPASDQRLDHLKDCLELLEVSERKLLTECYTRRGAIEQVAAKKGQSPSTIRGTLLRLRRRLHRCINLKLQTGATPS